uniref:G protein-coupled receptor n=1 Tax=Panagrellus redivivus TaxID=6233 RepID=A0A7E4W7Q3_PANRE
MSNLHPIDANYISTYQGDINYYWLSLLQQLPTSEVKSNYFEITIFIIGTVTAVSNVIVSSLASMVQYKERKRFHLNYLLMKFGDVHEALHLVPDVSWLSYSLICHATPDRSIASMVSPSTF